MRKPDLEIRDAGDIGIVFCGSITVNFRVETERIYLRLLMNTQRGKQKTQPKFHTS